MTGILSIGLSALLAQQRALATTSNNIANANTPGYSLQRVEFEERPGERLGTGFVGTGIDATLVRRITDEFIAGRLFSSASGFNRAAAFSGLAASIDDLLAADQTGLHNTLQSFVNAAQNLADDPASIPARQVVLSEARDVASRLQTFDRRLNEIAADVSTRLRAVVTEINGLGASIAEINQALIASKASPGGQRPPDLLDQRDRLVGRLAELIKVNTVEQSDGALSVFIGSGQGLVLGTTSATLTTVTGEFNPGQTDVVLSSLGSNLTITRFLSGGEVGGLLDFRREMLDPAQAELGRMAVGLVATFNSIHRDGMDLRGQLGGDFFGITASQVYASKANTGAASVAISVADVGAIAASAYQLSYDGSSFSLVRVADSTTVAMTGSGTVGDPFLADGLSIVVTGAAAAGDRFLLDPLADAAGTVKLLITDPQRVAAATPITTRRLLGNQGDATISPGEVADVTDPSLLATTTIAFLSPTTYSINGAGVFAYTSGADIVVNGSRVQITGTPATGDQFIIESNSGGIGDNRNALRLSGVLNVGILDAGTTNLLVSVGQLVSQVGLQTAAAMTQRDAQQLFLRQAEQALDSVRGVNLDEEAADLLRHEQAYQAAVQMITVADTIFQSLLFALRR